MMKPEPISLKDTVEPLLKELLAEAEFQSLPRMFVYPNSVLKKSILLLGINPSHSSENHGNIENYELLQKDNGHPYFKKFEEISEYCKTTWTHLDLLFFRETNQSKISNILKSKSGVDFIWRQLEVSKSLIELTEPQVIVVNNSLARTFLGFDPDGKTNVWLGFSFVFDNEIGTYRWNKVPVFFTSMLTGQRALDRGSYGRLKWHIRSTLIIETERKKTAVVELKNKVVRTQKYDEAESLRAQERALETRLSELRF